MKAAQGKRSLVDIAVAELGQHLADGRWPLGQRIPTEPELAEQLGMGRNTVREAVRVLNYAGLLEVRQGDGTYVRASHSPAEAMRAVGRASLREHLEVRCLLEESAARLAAQRASDADIATIADSLRQRGERRVGEPLEAFVDRDLAFHLAIANACGNTALAELYGYFSRAVHQHVQTSISDEALPDPDLAAHQAILDAIAARQPEQAAQAAAAITRPLLETLHQLLAHQEQGNR